jgi:protein-tyrosine phosphatase/membrane-associated phospholipid phosphatase
MTSVLLSLLFVVVYGGTNWWTAQRPEGQVGTWNFPWELTAIPYVPLLIVPYMSIDLFFAVAPFLCRNAHALRVFAQRVTFSIVTATVFFLLMPLKLAWPQRPRVAGWFGDLVEQSCSAPFLMDYPHNLFPALHIALCLILAEMYARHTRGVVRVVICIWFGLISVSTVLTWQHHVVDVAGGLVLGGFACYLWCAPHPRRAVVPNFRVGCYYAAGAATVLALVPAAWPWSVFLLWPAASLGIVAGGYFGLGPGIFRKVNGCLPWTTRLVLAPILIGQYVSLLYYRRRCHAWDEVVPGMLMGRTLTEAEAAAAVGQGVTAVLDLTAEFSETTAFRATRYRNLPILDLTAPTQEQLHEAVSFLAEEAANGVVYLHCKVGYSRSAAIAGAYLLASHQAVTVSEAVARLRRVRPSLVIRPEAMRALRSFERFVPSPLNAPLTRCG